MDLEIGFIEDAEQPPEEKLWQSCLNYAVSEACGRISGGETVKSDRDRIQKQAEDWIWSDSIEPYTFLWVCDVLGLDAWTVRLTYKTREFQDMLERANRVSSHTYYKRNQYIDNVEFKDMEIMKAFGNMSLSDQAKQLLEVDGFTVNKTDWTSVVGGKTSRALLYDLFDLVAVKDNETRAIISLRRSMITPTFLRLKSNPMAKQLLKAGWRIMLYGKGPTKRDGDSWLIKELTLGQCIEHESKKNRRKSR